MSAEKQPGEYGYEDTSFRAMGGQRGVRELVDHFYDAMAELPDARGIYAMHSNVPLARDKLAAFLCGWLGGPKLYRERWGPIFIPPAHKHLPIGPAERDAWLLCMAHAIEKMPVEEEFRRYFMREIAVPAGRIVQLRQRLAENDPGPG